MTIPNNISRNHILQGFDEIDQIGISSLRPATKFELIYKQKRYPPKEIIRFANSIANGYELRKFSGGDESNNFLIKLGFTIVLKDTDKIIGLDYTRKQRQGIESIIGTLNKKEFANINQEEIEDAPLTDTEKEQIVKARIGHSDFKKRLIKNDCKCKLCSITDEHFLIASHIKPWSHSSNDERLDLDNGFLLCPNHDALFDKGYITFVDDGGIMISDQVDHVTRMFLNISDDMKVELNEEQRQYLKWHREYVFKSKKSEGQAR